MPSINDFKEAKKNSSLFKKKDYRPWNEDVQLPHNKNDSKEIKKTSKNNSKVEEIITHELNSLDLERIWRHLYGAKKILLEQVINNIEEKNQAYYITFSLSTKQLEKTTSLPANTIRSNFQRLKKEGLIFFYERKPGIGGFARYKIPKSLYEFFSKKFSTNK